MLSTSSEKGDVTISNITDREEQGKSEKNRKILTLTRREKRKRGKGSDGQVLGERTELEKQIEDQDDNNNLEFNIERLEENEHG